jgi:AcrR family transcriptional regulator
LPAPTPAQQTRRDDGPLTERGARRKSEILIAARKVFEARGFVDTGVGHIVREARVSHGTFYTYFDTKDDIFRAVANDVVESMLTSLAIDAPNPAEFHGRVHDAIKRYIDAYRPHAAILAQMEHVGTFSPALKELRLDVRVAFVQRTRRGIRRMKERGLADPDLDEEYTAEALGAMLEYTCYLWFTLGHDFDENRLIDALSMIWEKSLLPEPRDL